MTKLRKAIKLRQDGKLEEASILLVELVKAKPEDAVINYQCAWCHDVMGKEKEAVAYYEKAIEIGLPVDDLKEAYLGLGSTYRTIGEYEKSKKLLEKGVEKFDDNAIRTFLAMTNYNLGNHAYAMEILLDLLAETSSDKSINEFKKAIKFYSDKLDQLW